MTVNRKVCIYRGVRKIGGDEWEWCYFYNAKIGDVKCETCEMEKMKREGSRRIDSYRVAPFNGFA